jgi:hypothetical protein
MYSYLSSDVLRYMFLMSAPANRAPLVLMVLFQRSLEETMSVVCMVISDKISTNSDMDADETLFLGTMINDNMRIRYHSVGRDTANVFIGKEENGFGSCGDSHFALGEMM